MARAITQIGLAADKAIVDAVKALVATYNQTKTAGEYRILTWDLAERAIVRAAIRKNRRGNTGFRGDVVLGSAP